MSLISDRYTYPLTLLVVGGVIATIGCGVTLKSPGTAERPGADYAPLVTEISPLTEEGAAPWIELFNPFEKESDPSKLVFVVNDTYRFTPPSRVAKVAPRHRVLIRLEEETGAKRLTEPNKNTTVLFAGAEAKQAIRGRTGQLAVYRRDQQGREVLVDFVSWGAPGSFGSLTKERDSIWRKRWFVPLANNFGDYDEEMFARSEKFTLGRFPGDKGQHPSAWVLYFGDDRTPGTDNSVPRIDTFTLAEDATIRSEDIAVGWTSNFFNREFRFQLARDSAFEDPVEDVTLTEAYFAPSETLPEGVYYYRVKAVDAKGRESAWSKTMTVRSKRFSSAGGGAGEDGAITAEVVLTDMQFRRQRKDTNLLCLDGCPSHLDGTTVKHWDNIHPDAVPVHGVDHGFMNCVRASIAMMASFYGHTLSQDRISYFTNEERAGVGNGIPEDDLAHGDGMGYSAEETAALEWALDETIADFFDLPNPSFADLKGWLDANRPIMTRTPGHLRAMNGYREEDTGEEWVHILDPWSGERWEAYATWNGAAQGTWVGPVAAPNARDDEPEIASDTDGDGVMDFDEQVRFLTGRSAVDSDHDDVDDKEDIYEYVFQFGDVYAKRDADFDADGVRKENDPDNDSDTYNDGCEDQNGNGIFESAVGETDNFVVDAGLVCGEKPVHAIIVFDRSGSMVHPSSDPFPKYDRATDAATLFLDAWLASDPPDQTKVGLVYYDNTSRFDTGAATNTTLEILDDAKRDKIVDSFATNRPDHGSTSIGGAILKAVEPDGFDIATMPTDTQNRVLVVLTDGKENSGTRMDDPAVTQALVNGEVDGYVLGIGDATQIDETKLNTLATILNHSPASFAKDLDEFELEKFFLQVLAETQGMEFSTDPTSVISPGDTATHALPVNPGAERVTFVVVWNESNGKIEFALSDSDGVAVTADVTKTHNRYQVSAVNSPKPGTWTLTATASVVGTPAPASIHYSVMAMEKNTSVSANFQVAGMRFLTGERLRLVADLSQAGRALKNGFVEVAVQKPEIGMGTFIASTQIRVPNEIPAVERGVVLSKADKKYQLMAQRRIRPPMMTTTIRLRDDGKGGDEIPLDGRYTGIFDQTGTDGIYTFRFIASAGRDDKTPALNREKVITTFVKPRIHPQKSAVRVLKSQYRKADAATHLTLSVTPKDVFGNLLGPGATDLLEIDADGSRVLKVTDNLDGSYVLELVVPGRYRQKPALRPAFKIPAVPRGGKTKIERE